MGINMKNNTDKNTINIVTTCNGVVAMTQDLTAVEKHISNIVRLNLVARPLKQAYLDAMNTSSGYTASEGVTILNNDKNQPAGVTFQSTFYNVKAALSAGYITVVKTEPSQELKDAVKALDAAQSDLTAFIASINTSLQVVLSKTRNTSGNTLEVRASQSKKDIVVASLKGIDPGCNVVFDDGRRFTVTLSNGKSKSYDIFGQSFLQSIANEV